ncbi:beta-lactamase family protein [Fulvivirga sp. M361]|uniref:serine hydrolase domain-containing protein n=1 Tax=Fulvivirga sp. M361 TaxID=2594266 RepID=UPI001179F620|nr:serine hydrolase domain-containing protein [Fulvivirga sp. M361]TRX47047.1 beta-lactamase family protein [Fulvivirga sp. M361]
MKENIQAFGQQLKYLFLLFFSLILSCNNESEKQSDGQLTDDYSSRIDSLIATTHPRIFNGVVLITKGAETKYVREYGYSDFENKTPISINDQFRIMSNSKQITAALLLMQVENRKIDLQHSIKEYLPDFHSLWADSVTIHQLLNMSSGIVDFDKPLLFEPGKGYRYSNPGYGLLGRIIEKVTGKTFIDNAHSLFEELGMNDTYCYELNQPRDGLINGYWIKDGELTPVDFDSIGITEEDWKDFIPAGGIISNTKDLTIWDNKLHKGEILDPDYLKLMVSVSNRGPHAAFDNDTIGYAYGLRIHDTHQTFHLGHGGRGFGFASIKFYIPEKDVDVIIWENIYSRDADWLAGDIVYQFENEIRKIVLNSSLVK